jgi:hypothetical protein
MGPCYSIKRRGVVQKKPQKYSMSTALEVVWVGTKKARYQDRAQRITAIRLVPGTLEVGDSLPPFAFSTFPTAAFARFFVAFLELKSPEKAIILNLLFQHFHGPLKVIINDPNF